MPKELQFSDSLEAVEAITQTPRNLDHLGYIREVKIDVPYFLLASLCFAAAFAPEAHQVLRLVLLGLALVFSHQAVFPETYIWVDSNGKNRHRFRPTRYRPVQQSTGTQLEQARAAFQQEKFEDPNLGEIECNFGRDHWQARAQGVLVFVVRKVWKDSDLAKIEGRHATSGMRREVLADRRLNPESIERLVEKYAVGHDLRQIVGYVHEHIGQAGEDGSGA